VLVVHRVQGRDRGGVPDLHFSGPDVGLVRRKSVGRLG
jgi:hypothetical protein